MNFFKPKSRKPLAVDAPASASASAPSAAVGRRGLVLGAGVAGAAAVAAAAMQRGGAAGSQIASAAPETDAHDGYRLTDHIKRYYATTRS